jgi:hypothetical protein
MGYLNDSTMRAHTVSEALAALAASPAAFWVADPSPIGFQMRRLEKGFFAACPAPFDSGAVLYNLRSNSKTGVLDSRISEKRKRTYVQTRNLTSFVSLY